METTVAGAIHHNIIKGMAIATMMRIINHPVGQTVHQVHAVKAEDCETDAKAIYLGAIIPTIIGLSHHKTLTMITDTLK